METVTDFIFLGSKITTDMTAAMDLNGACSLEEKIRQCVKKQRHYFANKGPSSQSYSFPSRHEWIWELDCKESWVPKNWYFWTVVLENTLESPLDRKDIKPVSPKGNQPWIFIGKTDAEAEAPMLSPPHVKWRLTEKVPGAGKDWSPEVGMTEDEMAGWASLTWWTWVWGNSGMYEGQGSLVGCSSWGHRAGHDWVIDKPPQQFKKLV